MNMILHLLFVTTVLSSTVQSAKILVFICQLFKSHHLVFHPIIKELAIRGHVVDYYTHHPIANPPKTLNQVQLPLDNYLTFMSVLETMEWDQPILPQFHYTKTGRDFKLSGLHEDCFQSEKVQDLFASNKTYDVVIGEFYMLQEDFSVLIHKFNALGVSILSFPDHSVLNEFSGLPNNPSYMIPFTSYNTDVMPFMERLRNFIDLTLSTILDYYYLVYPTQKYVDERIIYEGWESRPTVTRMASDMALILINSHHSLGYSYPTAPHVKHVLGTNVDYNPTHLPTDLQEFMDNAEHGVVYFSLGSMVGVKVLQLRGSYDPIFNVLSNLKQKVLWKWSSSNEQPPKVSNITFSKWLPQQSILAHNKTRLFITHGGLGSLTEAVFHGVPLIAIPVWGDQPKNVKLLTKLGLGVELQLNNLTEILVESAINEVLNNQKYKRETLKRSAIFRDRPMKPVDEAVYWIEYVLRHGKVLQPVSTQMPFYQLYLLDVISFFFFSTAIIFFALSYSIRKLFRIHRIVSRLPFKTSRESNINELCSKKNK